jgi:hypothetical protein
VICPVSGTTLKISLAMSRMSATTLFLYDHRIE